MSEFCKDHKCIKEKVDSLQNNRKFWHRLFGSNWSYFILTGIIIIVLAFASWTVNEIYAQKANEKENKTVAKEISQNIKDIKDTMKEESKKRDDQREKDQEKLMKVLMEIQKQTKK